MLNTTSPFYLFIDVASILIKKKKKSNVICPTSCNFTHMDKDGPTNAKTNFFKKIIIIIKLDEI
jgi:hypothetical protein